MSQIYIQCQLGGWQFKRGSNDVVVSYLNATFFFHYVIDSNYELIE